MKQLDNYFNKGSSAKSTVESVFYMKILNFTLVISVLNIIGNLYVGLNPQVNIKWLVLIPTTILSIYFNSRGRFIRISQAILFGCVIFIFIPNGWRTSGGYNYLTLGYVMIIAISIGFIMDGWLRNILILSEFVVFSRLVYIQYTSPVSVSPVDYALHVKDLMVQIPIIFFSTVYMTIIFANAWRNERKRLNEYSDILQKQNEHLDKINKIDELTGLYNRRYLFERLKALAHSGKSASIVMVDIDNFKHINDTYGHLIGDDVISSVANCIKDSVGSAGFVGRYGGDEFIIVLEAQDEGFAFSVTQVLQKRIKDLRLPNQIQITVSGGISVLQSGGQLDEALASADTLMYWVKQNGKAKVAGQNQRAQKKELCS